jgi:hypothetical protein
MSLAQLQYSDITDYHEKEVGTKVIQNTGNAIERASTETSCVQD